MSEHPLTLRVRTALAAMTPNPFTQAAIWGMYEEAPSLLDAKVLVELTWALDPDADAQTIFDRVEALRHPTTRKD